MLQQAPLASSRATGFVTVKTPDGHVTSHDALAGVSAWSSRFRLVGNFAQLLIFASMGLYVFGQLIYFTPTYSDGISVTFKEWWGVATTTTTTTGGASAAPKGHSEMVLPTHFLLFGMLPLFVSALLIEFLRHFNLRRISSHYMLKTALVLRRKPALFGRVSHWSYGEWLFLFGLIGGNVYVFYHFYSSRMERMKSRIKGDVQFNVYLECIALTLGFSCIFNLAFLFLPATRNCAWMEFFNISYANGIKYHRWLGVITVLTAFVHCVGYYWSWIRQGTWQAQALPCFDCNLGERKGLKVWFNVFGEIALLIFLVIGLTSIPFIRRKFYNVFYYSHQLLFLGVIFSVMHWGNVVWWVLPPFVIYCFSRAMSMSSNFSPIDVGEVTAISHDIVKVVIKRSPGRDGHYRVGQFLYLNVPAISKLQWHAFTISSSPRSSPTAITVLIKSLGDWTDELVQHANECQAKNVLPTVYVDGFYGASLELYNEYSTVCLVGGGIGVTPLFSVLEDICAKLSSRGSLQQKVVFIFSFRELALLEEIHPVLLRLRELDPHEQYFRMYLFLTRVPSDDVLNTRIDTTRLQGKRVHPTVYETKALPVAFTEPLRSRTYRALAMTTVVAAGVLFVVYLHYGGDKIKLIDPALWPLQQFAEASVAILAGGLVLLYVFAERLSKHKGGRFGDAAAKEIETNFFDSATTPALAFADVHTYNDLISQYRVALGARPDTEQLLAKTFEFHADESIPTEGSPVVGVFVSGPVAMKRAVDRAVREIGVHHFDVHEEEFEL